MKSNFNNIIVRLYELNHLKVTVQKYNENNFHLNKFMKLRKTEIFYEL